MLRRIQPLQVLLRSASHLVRLKWTLNTLTAKLHPNSQTIQNHKSQISISPILFLHLFHFLLSTRASLSLTFSLPPLPHAHLSCSAPPASISNANKTRSLIRRILVLACYKIGGAAAKQSAILKSIFHPLTIRNRIDVRKKSAFPWILEFDRGAALVWCWLVLFIDLGILIARVSQYYYLSFK